jgi:bifunctional DNA-binding transcriptional regulator/antitoxin component of YhaV-PrlF toxin-antitoxin module
MVIPKALREELGVSGPTDLELTATDGRLELTVPDVPARIEMQDGFPVILAEQPVAPLGTEETRAALDSIRR